MITERKVWDHPWDYKEGIIITLTILLLGFTLEYSTGGAGITHLIVYPNNIYFGIGFVVILLLISLFGRSSPVVEWLESIPAAIFSIGLLLFVSLLMGLTMQYDNNATGLIRKLGLSHIVTSWPYMLSNLFLLITLGLITIKNLRSFRWNKIGFIVSHVGLWIVLFGANFGTPQMQRLQMEVHEGEIVNTSVDISTNESHTMPFAVKLVDFILDEYNPKLALINNKSGKVFQTNGMGLMIIDSGASSNINEWHITVDEYLYSSAKAGNKYYSINEMGAAPSAFITAINTNGNTVEGWISCGSYNRPYESLKLDDNYSVVMLFPEPKEFTSVIEIYKPNSDPIYVNLKVNKPMVVDGWKLYQLSYDSKLGKWSDISVIELIRDPWLPIVYTGIFLMLIGAIYMFWMGTSNRKTKVDDKPNKTN